MSVSQRKKIGFIVGSSTVLVLFLAYGFWKYKQLVPEASPPSAVTAPIPTPVATPSAEEESSEMVGEEGVATEPEEGSCNRYNTFGEGDKSTRMVSAELQFRATVSEGDPLLYTLPFALKPGQKISFRYETEDVSHEATQCITEESSVRCAEVFYNQHESYCGPLKLADGSEKFVQFFLELKDKAPPLPVDLEKYAIKKESRALGVFAERLSDETRTAASKLPAYLPIQIWESSDPSAKMIGEVPSGFFLLSDTQNAVYIEKVGDRYLTNLLAMKPGVYQTPAVYHWLSNIRGLSYEEIVTDTGWFCLQFVEQYCQNPSKKDCQNYEAGETYYNRDDFEVDKAQPILRNENDWVVLKPKAKAGKTLPTLYVDLQQYVDEVTTECH